MDFLTKLYSNENFGIILFASVSILVLIFLIILFFGKKDQKHRLVAETNQPSEIKDNPVTNEINSEPVPENATVAFADIEPSVPVETKESPTQEEPKDLQSTMIAIPGMALKTELINQATNSILENNGVPVVDESESPEPPKTDFDFDALAASISKELENIGIEPEESTPPINKEEMKKEPLKEEVAAQPIINQTVQNPTINKFEPKYFEPKEPKVEETKNIVKEETKTPEPIKIERKEPPKITPHPTQFSSVFVNNKRETNIPLETNNIEVEPIKEVTKIEQPKIIPVKPTMEMPKVIDLPKLNPNSKPKVKPLEEKTSIKFPSLENDIPAYTKSENNRM